MRLVRLTTYFVFSAALAASAQVTGCGSGSVRRATFLTCDFDGTCTSLPGSFTLDTAGSGVNPVISTDVAHSGAHSVKFQVTSNAAPAASAIFYTFASPHPVNPSASLANGVYHRWWQYFDSSVVLAIGDYSPDCRSNCAQMKVLLDRTDGGSNCSWDVSGFRQDNDPPMEMGVEQDSQLDRTMAIHTSVTVAAGQWYEFQTNYQRTTQGSVTTENVGGGDGSTLQFSHQLAHIPAMGSLVVHYTVGGTSYSTSAVANGNHVSGTYVDSGQSGVCFPAAGVGSLSCSDGKIWMTFIGPPDKGTTISVDYTYGRARSRLWINGSLVADSGWETNWGYDGTPWAQKFRNGIVYVQNLQNPSGMITYIDDYVISDTYVSP